MAANIYYLRMRVKIQKYLNAIFQRGWYFTARVKNLAVSLLFIYLILITIKTDVLNVTTAKWNVICFIYGAFNDVCESKCLNQCLKKSIIFRFALYHAYQI